MSSFAVPYKGNRGIIFNLIGNKSRITPKIVGDKLNFEVNIEAKAVLEETDIPVNLKKPETVKNLTKDLNKLIKDEVEKTLLKVQKEYKSDIFGFGQKFHRKYRKEWKQVENNWDETFAGAEINIKVKTEITGSELVENSF